jgi:transposase
MKMGSTRWGPRIRLLIRLPIEDLRTEWRALDERIAVFDKEFVQMARNEEPVRRLVTIPGIGTINATARVAAAGNARAFRRGRDMAAWLGLTPARWRPAASRDAPWVLDGPISGKSFRVYVERVLVPALAQGAIVVMDNSPPAGGVRRAPLGSHKGKAIRRAIGAAGAGLFFLPPTAPISTRSILRRAQEVLAKLEHFLRKAAERTAAATGTRIGTLLDDFSPAERANYFVNSGYASV